MGLLVGLIFFQLKNDQTGVQNINGMSLIKNVQIIESGKIFNDDFLRSYFFIDHKFKLCDNAYCNKCKLSFLKNINKWMALKF